MTDQAVHDYLSKLGKRGAEVANQARTPKQRKKIAKKAAEARWGKRKKEKA